LSWRASWCRGPVQVVQRDVAGTTSPARSCGSAGAPLARTAQIAAAAAGPKQAVVDQ
jgi:hypothetical protein